MIGVELIESAPDSSCFTKAGTALPLFLFGDGESIGPPDFNWDLSCLDLEAAQDSRELESPARLHSKSLRCRQRLF